MHPLVRPAARLGLREHRVEHHLRAADVELVVRAAAVEQRGDVQRRAGLVVGMDVERVAEQRLQLGQEGHQLAAAAGVVHAHRPPVDLRRAAMLDQRRDADAAGDQHRAAGVSA